MPQPSDVRLILSPFPFSCLVAMSRQDSSFGTVPKSSTEMTRPTNSPYQQPSHPTAGLKGLDYDCLMETYAGNRSDGPYVLGQALKAKHRKFPGVLLLDVERTKSKRAGPGGVIRVTCGLCSKFDKKLQSVAEHMISAHLNLNLWYCDQCIMHFARKWDLRRHQKDQHGIVTPKKPRKSGSRAAAVSPFPSIPPSPSPSHLSAGPGPTRSSMSRSRSPSRSPINSQPYWDAPFSPEDGSRHIVGNGSGEIRSPLNQAEVRGRQATRSSLFAHRGVSQTAMPTIEAPPMIYEPPAANDDVHHQNLLALSLGEPGMGFASSRPTDPSERQSSSQPYTNSSAMGPCPLDAFDRSQFLPVTNAGASSDFLSPPVPIFHVTAPIQSQQGVLHTPRYLQLTHNGFPNAASNYPSQPSTPGISPLRMPPTPPPIFEDFDNFYPNHAQVNLTAEDYESLWEACTPASERLELTNSSPSGINTQASQRCVMDD